MTSVLPRTVAPAPRAEPVRPSPHPGRAGLLTALPGCAVAFALAYWAFVRTAAGQQIENAVVLDAQAGRASAPDLFAGALASMDVGPCVCAGVLTVLAIGFARQRFAAGGAAAGLVVGSLLVARLLKLTLLTRADLDPGSAVARHNSFPSGHVSAAVAVLLALAIVLPRGARPWVMIPGAVGVGWVAYATVLLGWHRPSDAVGASLLVVGICCGTLALLTGSRTDAGAARCSPEAAVVALVAPALLAGGTYAAVWLATPDAHSAAGLAGVASSALVLFVLWLLTPRRPRPDGPADSSPSTPVPRPSLSRS